MKAKKILEKTVSAVTYILLFLTLILLGLVFTARVKGEIPTIYGYSIHIVVSPSMSTNGEDSIDVGDMVLIRHVGKSEIKKGDVILFTTDDPSLKDSQGKAMLILHRVKEVNQAENEEDITFVTKGDANTFDDNYPANRVVGVLAGKSSFLGKIMSAFSSWRNMLFLFVVIALIFSTGVIFKKLLNTVKEEDKAVLTSADKDRIAVEVAAKLIMELRAKERQAKETKQAIENAEKEE